MEENLNDYAPIASAEDFLKKVVASVTNLKATLPQNKETVAVTANEAGEVIKKESTMDELKKEECGTAAAEEPTLEAKAAEDKPAEENPFAADSADKKEDKKEDEGKEEGKGEDKKEDKPAEEKKKEIKESDFKKAEGLLNKVLENEMAEATEGEDESEDIKNIKEAMKALGAEIKAKEEEEPVKAEEAPVDELAPLPEAPEAPVAEEKVTEEETLNPFASLTATLQRKATIADSVWMIKQAKDNSDYLSFSVKAAFGNNIDNDAARSEYATSPEFGKAVIAALINEKVASATGAKAAVLGVVAHYTPSYPGVNDFKDNKESEHAKASGEGDTETDKNLPKVEKTAAAKETLAVKAAEEGKECEKDTFLPGADNRPVKENTDTEKSATPHATEQIPTEGDRKLIASYKEQLEKQASEIQSLKLEAAIKEKTAKVKECVTMMCRAGLIKANEQVRIAALKDGLSIEAANAKAMAASIDSQSKNLFGMNTPQLDSYMKSLAELAPRAKAVTASSNTPLTVKATETESEIERLSKILGWD